MRNDSAIFILVQRWYTGQWTVLVADDQIAPYTTKLWKSVATIVTILLPFAPNSRYDHVTIREQYHLVLSTQSILLLKVDRNLASQSLACC